MIETEREESGECARTGAYRCRRCARRELTLKTAQTRRSPDGDLSSRRNPKTSQDI